MSLKQSILAELSKGPKNQKQLRGAVAADNKKINKTIKSLLADKKIKFEKSAYAMRPNGAPVVESQLVKLGRSFGFASALDGSGDIFIPGHSLAGAMPGDQLLVSLSQYPRRAGTREGEVYAITQRKQNVIGTVDKQHGELVFIPDSAPDTPLRIRKSADGGAKVGEKVAGVILEYGDRHDDHEVGITVRFGSADSARQSAKALLYGAGIEKSFSADVKNDAKKVASEGITKEEIKKRKDLRNDPIFTIDSASTKDIDDAVSIKKVLDGYLLGVHIADVSHYVKAKSALDCEALNRGTSIYYADSVIPMLPRQLSNGICSLNPGEDRLAFSCVMTLDHDGSMLDYRFFKTVINSRVKGVYAELNDLAAGAADKEISDKYASVAQSIPILQELYVKLTNLRADRGSMEIESEEPKLILDAEGHCVDVQKRERGLFERIIEELMLLANTAAAHLARRADIPFIYRVHDKPSAERVENLRRLLVATGIDFKTKGDIPTQKELSGLLDQTRGTNLELPVHMGVLRSMAKADYEPQNKGHFGLALQDYTHFTSPIRRYPDLAIHRILSDYIAGTPTAQLRKKYKTFAEEAAMLSSEKEVQAQQIERHCDDSYKAEYMHGHLGESFTGVVVSVVPYGLYVALPNTVEGLIHISHLSDNKMELREGFSLTDPLSGKSYRIGDEIRVTVAGVNVSQGNIDFVPDKD